jgi:hypothetical protein
MARPLNTTGDAKKTANQAAKQTVPREDSQEEVSSVVHSDAGME